MAGNRTSFLLKSLWIDLHEEEDGECNRMRIMVCELFSDLLFYWSGQLMSLFVHTYFCMNIVCMHSIFSPEGLLIPMFQDCLLREPFCIFEQDDGQVDWGQLLMAVL